MTPLQVAEDLARRLARAWIAAPGRDNRHRDRRHPLGWLCGDLSRTLCDEAVAGWKRAQRRQTPKATPILATVQPALGTLASPQEAAIRSAENKAIMTLMLRGVDFNEALRLGRAEGANARAALALAAPSLLRPAVVAPGEPHLDAEDRAPPE